MKVLCCGVGEYTTGFIPGSTPALDKSKGVVGICLMDMKARGKIDGISMVGVDGKKLPAVRQWMKECIENCYVGIDATVTTFPADGVFDPLAYRAAIDSMSPGDGVIIFTPDDTHYDIALYAIQHKLHVLLTKPAVKTVREHLDLMREAEAHGVHVQIEFHKRWDPIYSDARIRLRGMGSFSYFWSYMSQPKRQLNTFRAWAGVSSDISYYLNSHHIDFHCWTMEGRARPLRVMASSSSGVATAAPFNCVAGTEDSITLLVDWEMTNGDRATATYTAAWSAPNDAETHTQQKFLCLSHAGEVRVDQAHRGYEVTTDGKYASANPLFMRFTPDERGRFAGQRGYGYLSIESFIDACASANAGDMDALSGLPTLQSGLVVTAILEAGRQSLDRGGEWVAIQPLL